MEDFTDGLLAVIAKPSTRRDVVPLYAEAILFECFTRPPAAQTRWSVVNAAIIERWSIAGLTFIKTQAWKRAQVIATERAEAQSIRAGTD